MLLLLQRVFLHESHLEFGFCRHTHVPILKGWNVTGILKRSRNALKVLKLVDVQTNIYGASCKRSVAKHLY